MLYQSLGSTDGTYSCQFRLIHVFIKWAILGLFFVYFRSFQTNKQQINVKNVHPAQGFELMTF